MKIIDLSPEYEAPYFVCLEDWSSEMAEAGSHKEQWYRKMQDHGLRVKLALDDREVAGGMIQYAPIENVPVEGNDLYYTYCIWVHGYKEGPGQLRNRGMGSALLRAAEKDVRELGGKGLVVWGMTLPFFMRASWFRKHGYRRVDRDGVVELLWKPFAADAVPPKWIRRKKRPTLTPGAVTVTCLRSGWCPAQNLVCERARRAVAELGEDVVLQEVDTFDRERALEWGVTDALFVDGKRIRTGPPPSYERIKHAIAERLHRFRKHRHGRTPAA